MRGLVDRDRGYRRVLPADSLWAQKQPSDMCFSTALGRFELAAEVFQFVCAEIADRPQREARLTPVPNIESLHRLHRGAAFVAASLRDKQIDDVGAPPIGQSRTRLAVKEIEAPADERESQRGEIGDRRRHV